MARIEIRSEADVVEAVLSARADGTTLEIAGGQTKRDFGRPIEVDHVLAMSALSGIASYEPDELVMTVAAATTIAEIEDALAPRAQRLAFDPADWGPLLGTRAHASTIAGVLSADACGSSRVRFGAARDHLLGYRAVNGLGECYKAGGHVVKNVTGFDLPKLVCGAMGTLGVLTEITVRLVPDAPGSATLVARDMSPRDGFAMLRQVWTSAFGATGLAYIPRCMETSFPSLGPIGRGAAVLRVEGDPLVLQEKIAGVRGLVSGASLEACDDRHVFRAIGDGRAFAGVPGDVWRLCIPPQAAAPCAELLASERWIGDWAGGLLWVGTIADDAGAAQRIRAAASAHGGHATLLRASNSLRRRIPVFQPDPPHLAALTKSVKAAFDPLGVFNPGRMVEGI